MKQPRPMTFDILDDPLIRQMMKADGVSRDELARLLSETSVRLRLSPSSARKARP